MTMRSLPCEAAPRPREVVVRRARPLMGTIVAVTARGPDPRHLDATVRAMFGEMERLQAIFSEFDPRSAVSAIGASAGGAAVRVPPELVAVLEAALEVAARSDGAFDPTWRPLADVWDFHATEPHVPTPRQVAERVRLVAYQDVVVDPHGCTVRLRRAGMRLGLGGVAKAFVAERAAELAGELGVRDVLVDAGGDVVARGRNGARPWTVAVRDPRSPGMAMGSVELQDATIATSGDYERCFVVNGRRYHHLLDPRTGYPAGGTRSVTVIAARAPYADALATALFVLGASRGKELVSTLRGVTALWMPDRL